VTLAASASPVWEKAQLAAALFAIDPVGLGGVVVRGGPGGARDRWLATIKILLASGAPLRRIPLRIEDDRLLGGLDLPASLSAGRPVAQRGVLADSDGGVAILAMAERIEPGVAARLAAALDQGEIRVERDGLALRLSTRFGLIALDEGVAPEERPPDALLDRLAFRLDLTLVGAREAEGGGHASSAIEDARARLARVETPDLAIVEAICQAAEMLGVASLRAPLLTLRAARAHAALEGRERITADDAAVAARLVLAPRATTAPSAEAEAEAPNDAPNQDDAPDPPPSDDMERDPDTKTDESQAAPDTERVVEAIQAALPEDLLAQAAINAQVRAVGARAQGSGAAAKSARRGRPVGSRPGALRSGARLNLVDTLRAAAPWQRLRSGETEPGRILVSPSDFRIRRFVQRMEATTIFVVDASGSTAFQRLAEAKGAVELLLAKAYVSRARVALIAFRGAGAELLLPPTRSLTRAKNRLADLPGGGGTPLAAAMDAALVLAQSEKAKDHTPMLVFLTDGRANITRDGGPGRAVAQEEALGAARLIAESNIASVFVDTSPRAQPDGDRFARAMNGAYAPLPYVEATAMAGLVAELGTARR
jgi:magnesium chelatase subunit D